MRAASLFSENAIHVTLVYALCHRQPVHLTYRRTLENDFRSLLASNGLPVSSRGLEAIRRFIRAS